MKKQRVMNKSYWTDCLITNGMLFVPVCFLFTLLVSNMNIEAKEQLTIEIQKYPCLYDKANYNYKNRVQNDLAWAEIAKNLAMEGWL